VVWVQERHHFGGIETANIVKMTFLLALLLGTGTYEAHIPCCEPVTVAAGEFIRAFHYSDKVIMNY